MRKGRKYFAVRYNKNARQTHASKIIRTAKYFLKELHLVCSEMRKGRKYFAVRYNKNARPK
jgi:hypothetical protein